MARVKPAAESQGLTEQLTNRPGGAARGQRGLRPSPASRHRGTDQWAAAEGACALACLREARGVRPLHRLGVGGGHMQACSGLRQPAVSASTWPETQPRTNQSS